MNTLQAFLVEREQPDDRSGRSDDDLLLWLNHGLAPEVRLLKFDAWLSRELATRLDWTWAGDAKARRIEQCRVYLQRIVLDLWRRGWMLDGKRLADHLKQVLDSVGAYQRAGKVGEFWPYFRASVDRYVGANAEEIRAEAMRAGAHIGNVLSALGVKRPATGPTMPELVAQRAAEVAQTKAATMRERLARQRAADKADATQAQLF